MSRELREKVWALILFDVDGRSNYNPCCCEYRSVIYIKLQSKYDILIDALKIMSNVSCITEKIQTVTRSNIYVTSIKKIQTVSMYELSKLTLFSENIIV